MRKSKDFDLEFSPLIPKKPLFFLPLRNTFFLYIILSSPYLPSDILREIYDMNAYLKLTCLTLGSPFSLHQVKENGYLTKVRYNHTLIKVELLFSKSLQCNCINKTFLSKKESLLCLGVILVLITAHFHYYTHFPHFRSASNQNIFKVFSLLVFRKTSNDKTNYKADCKFFSLKNTKASSIQLALTLKFLLGLR